MTALKAEVRDLEVRRIREALSAAKGHRGRAAAALGMSLRALHRRLDALALRDELPAMARAEGWPASWEAGAAARRKAGKEASDG